jgi:hypothetical protein
VPSCDTYAEVLDGVNSRIFFKEHLWKVPLIKDIIYVIAFLYIDCRQAFKATKERMET